MIDSDKWKEYVELPDYIEVGEETDTTGIVLRFIEVRAADKVWRDVDRLYCALHRV